MRILSTRLCKLCKLCCRAGTFAEYSMLGKQRKRCREDRQKVYEIHLLKVPEGYKPDTNVYNTPDIYSDVNIFLEKAE